MTATAPTARDADGGRRTPQGSSGRRPGSSVTDYVAADDDGTLGGTQSYAGTASSTLLGAGAGAPTATALSLAGVPRTTNLFQLSIQDPGTGFVETALLSVPVLGHGGKAPLLVCYHAYGHTEYDIPVHTTLFHEAFTRDWFALASLGATKRSYSSVPSQVNRLAMLELVLNLTSIDRTRIYGIGFSMGGGACLNFAARHLDPAGPMFAALVNHSGALALRHVYSNEWNDGNTPPEDPPLEAPDVLDYWHNGAPSPSNIFSYQRSSAIDVDPVTDLVLPTGNLAINLRHVPMLNIRLTNDAVAYAALQTNLLHDYVVSIGGDSTLEIIGGSFHGWQTLDESAACDFLAQHQLVLPTNGDLLIDRDATYFYFDVVQAAPNAFTSFHWSMTPVENILQLTSTKNLQEVTVQTVAGGLDPTNTMLVLLSTTDGAPDVVRLRDIPSVPSAVERDGQPETAWSYDVPSQTLTLLEYDGDNHTWEITP